MFIYVPSWSQSLGVNPPVAPAPELWFQARDLSEVFEWAQNVARVHHCACGGGIGSLSGQSY